MRATTAKLPFVLLIVGLGVALCVFPFMFSLLFGAGAEAFLGQKEPMLLFAAGLVIGTAVAAVLGAVVFKLGYAGFAKFAWAIVIAVIAFDATAIPFARWLIRLAYASPTNVIEW